MSTEAPSIEKAFHKAMAEPGLFGVAADADAVDGLRGPDGRLPRNAFQLIRQQERAQRGRGRPRGAGNKRNEQIAKLICQKFGDPVQAMASLYAMPLDQLVELVKLVDPGKDGKAGDIAIKALNVQLAAAKATAEYVHSKKPVEATVNVRTDGVLVFPGGVAGTFEQLDDATRGAAALIQQAMDAGTVTADMLAGMRLVDGRLIDAEYEPVDEGAMPGDGAP